ncbi:amidohydrolase family protein [Microbacterium sp. SA39]|uniref:amidohydrolase family protein n=1 Tax=Microbacterium sp. SA39 TaxID=1263625 RepID=UPI00190FCBFA|nr:amidohydrolase family protein [Microbacterium sp. SA39]
MSGEVESRSRAARRSSESAPYELSDFSRVRKFDAHVHLNVEDPTLPDLARENGFELLSINADSPDFPDLLDQRAVAAALAKDDPARIHWATTFSMMGFGTRRWLGRVTAGLAEAKAEGACAVKVWKNIGMTERDADGRLILLDHPVLEPVIDHARSLGLPVIGHQGEPHNCWLPLEHMTTDSDRRYFERHPHFHMHRWPDRPSYEDLIAMRDRFLTTHPRLQFVGAHMGSLEHDIDRLAGFLDRFPRAVVDLASRMSHVQCQSLRDHEHVRAFFIRYQDRLLYGSDMTFNAHTDPVRFRRVAPAIWVSDWRYLATAESQRVGSLRADVPGLALPRDVIDKVYCRNALRVYAISGDGC